MGTFCGCGVPETPRIGQPLEEGKQEVTLLEIAKFRNKRLRRYNFNYFGPILKLSGYTSKPLKN